LQRARACAQLLDAPSVAEALRRWRHELDAMFAAALSERRHGIVSERGEACSGAGHALNIGAFFEEIKKKKARARFGLSRDSRQPLSGVRVRIRVPTPEEGYGQAKQE
jgi:hypothetical protein